MCPHLPPDTWTELAKAWAPTVVAVVVVIVTAIQNRWQRQFSERQLAADRQKIQLTSMDKRLAVLSALTDVLAKLPFDQDETTRAGFFNSLLAGQLLFSKPIADRLEQAWMMQIRYSNARAVRLSIAGRGQWNARDDEAEAQLARMREELRSTLEGLRSAMIASGRVVAPGD